jgi:hypothetical protein
MVRVRREAMKDDLSSHLKLNLEARVAAVLGLVVCRGNGGRRRAHGDIQVCGRSHCVFWSGEKSSKQSSGCGEGRRELEIWIANSGLLPKR